MTTPDWPARAPTLAELTELGAIGLRVWAIEFEPPLPNNRAPSGKNVPSRWKAQIDSANSTRPSVVAIRKTAQQAEEDVRRGFWQHYSKKPNKYPAPEQPLDLPMTPATELDDDFGMELI